MNTFLKDNWFKLVIAIVLLIMACSVFYYFVVFIPQKENVRTEQARQEVEKAKQENEQAKQDLESCLADADRTYTNFWLSECDAQGLLSTTCKKFVGVYDSTEYYKKYPSEKPADVIEGITQFYDRRDACSCLLPKYNADRAEEMKQNNKNECFKKYPQ